MNNFTHKLYLLTDDNPKYQSLIEQSQWPELEITNEKEEATILLAAPPKAANTLSEFPKLEWIQSVYAGVDALIPALQVREIELTNVKGIFGQLIAEYVLGYTIQHYRHFKDYQTLQAEKRWSPKTYQSLTEKRMLILGTGSIGCYLANTAKAMGLNVSGVNRSGIPVKNAAFDSTYHIQELDTALEQADIIVNTLPSTAETKAQLNQQSFSHCQQALLFNVGRGDVIEENDLLSAIDQGHIEHAFLDVFAVEPLADAHPFWHNPAITITPHIAALSFPLQVVDIFKDNYQRWRDGFSLISRVDIEKGY